MPTPRYARRDRQLVPKQKLWGCGYGNEYTGQEVDEIFDAILSVTPRDGLTGYSRGLIHEELGFDYQSRGVYQLPPDYDATNNSCDVCNVLDPLLREPNNPTSLSCEWRVVPYIGAFYRSVGGEVDQHGRWVHPHALQLMEHDVPLCTGYGVGREGGEAHVVSVVIGNNTHILRQPSSISSAGVSLLASDHAVPADFGYSVEQWHMGQRSPNTKGLHRAARRIIKQQLGFSLPKTAVSRIARVERPFLPHHTLNFWEVIYTVFVNLRENALPPKASGSNTQWLSRSDADNAASELRPHERRAYESCIPLMAH